MSFKLKESDLQITKVTGSTRGVRRGNRIQVTITHEPTGISVEGEVGPESAGRSRAQARAASDALTERLRNELTQRVAAHLRVPGR